jgi:hypothetical protein
VPRGIAPGFAVKRISSMAGCQHYLLVLFFLIIVCYNVMIKFYIIGEEHDFGSNRRGRQSTSGL